MRFLPSLLLLIGLWLISHSSLASIIFINEFHYDNNSTDTNEFIEIAGQAGIDLSGWSLQLYNGSTGSRYRSIALSGSLLATSNGMGVISVAAAGLQNGAPDGIALIDNLGSVIQFISYEGSFTAIDGDAKDLISEDIGIYESSQTPADYSLQLVGIGTNYHDFQWQAGLASDGEINIAQAFRPTTTVSEPQSLLIWLIPCLMLIMLTRQSYGINFSGLQLNH